MDDEFVPEQLRRLKQERFDMFLLGVFVGLIASIGCLMVGIDLAHV